MKIAEPVVTIKKTFPSKKIFVGGVPPDMPKETLREYFEQFGEVNNLSLVRMSEAVTITQIMLID